MNQRKRMRQRVVAGLNNPFVMLPATRRPELLHLMGEEKDEIDCKIDLKKTTKYYRPLWTLHHSLFACLLLA